MAGEDALGKEMTTHYSILARRILWTEESGWLQYVELWGLTPLARNTTIKMSKVKERTLKSAREKQRVNCKRTPIRLSADFFFPKILTIHVVSPFPVIIHVTSEPNSVQNELFDKC